MPSKDTKLGGPGLVLAVLAVASNLLSAQEWPHVRGPAQDGHSHGAALGVSESGPGFLWSVELGQGYSGVATEAGVLYTQFQDASGQYLVALNLADGTERWRTRYEDPWDPTGPWPGPYASPTLGAGLVCFAGCHGSVGCADAGSGEIRWQRDAKEEFGGQGTNFGYAASPLIHGDLVVLPIGGPSAGIVAFDLGTGATRWSSGSDEAGYTGSTRIQVGGRTQIVSSMAEAVVSVEPETGRELWRHPLRDSYNPHPAWLPYEEPFLLIPLALRHGSSVLRLDPASGKPSETAWESPVLSNDLFSSVIVDGFIFGFDIHDPQTSFNGPTKGEFKCVDLSNGEERWSTTKVQGASVITDGAHLYVMTEQSTLLVLDATPEAYRERSRLSVFPGSLSWTPPAISGDTLILRGGRHLAALSFEATGSDFTPPSATPLGLLQRWGDRHRAPSFTLPQPEDVGLWFAANLLCLLIATAVCLPIRHAPVAAGLLAGETVLLGAAAFPLLTELARRPVFTLPSVLFGGFVAVAWLGVMARQSERPGKRWMARLGLVAFAGLCLGYDFVCARLGFMAGRGFLVGFLPALPFVFFGVKRIYEGRWWAGVGITLGGYVAFFLGAAMIYFWRVGGA